MLDNAASVDYKKLHADALVWDAHSCLPLSPEVDITVLQRHHESGVDFLSINVGMDMNPLVDIIQIIASFRRQIAALDDQFIQVVGIDDVRRAKREGKMAIAFDLEGSVMLDNAPDMVDLFYHLGVRQIHLAYNRNNVVGGGCHDEDIPLSALGHRMVAAINKAGMLMDCSHTGYRTSMDVMAASSKPVIFSHSNPKALVDHPRTITDEQIRSCAATGGVIGINGVSLFLNDPEATPETIFRHIDYVAELVGPAHVGLGIDYEYELGIDDAPAGLDRNHWWPPEDGYSAESGIQEIVITAPEQIPRLTQLMLDHGYSEQHIRDILGLNFMAVAEKSWV